MIQNGNPNQWDKNNWPPEDLVKKDIENGKSYVCVDNDNISMQKLLEKNKFVKCGTIYAGG